MQSVVGNDVSQQRVRWSVVEGAVVGTAQSGLPVAYEAPKDASGDYLQRLGRVAVIGAPVAVFLSGVWALRRCGVGHTIMLGCKASALCMCGIGACCVAVAQLLCGRVCIFSNGSSTALPDGATLSGSAQPDTRDTHNVEEGDGGDGGDGGEYRVDAVATLCELPPDGFRWRKYGRKIVGSQGGVECVLQSTVCRA